MGFEIVEATPSDAEAIAHIFHMVDPGELMRLQLGSAKQDDMQDKMVERIKANMSNPEQVYVVAKDDESGELVSYSQWLLPKDMKEEDEATRNREKENFLKSLPAGVNMELVVEFREEIMAIRRNSHQYKRHYELLNLGTHLNYRKRGAASAVVKWSFDPADREGVMVYLDTQEYGNARSMYEHLGFKPAGSMSVDLKKYGGTSTHTHIAMIREPEAVELST